MLHPGNIAYQMNSGTICGGFLLRLTAIPAEGILEESSLECLPFTEIAMKKFFSWHRSSWCMACVTLLAVILIAVPGDVDHRYFSPLTSTHREIHFGWPYVHYILCEKKSPTLVVISARKQPSLEEVMRSAATRETLDGSRWMIPASSRETFDSALNHHRDLGGTFAVPQEEKRFWSHPKNWRYFREDAVGKVFWLGLLANIAIAISGSLFVGGLFELRRRRLKRFWSVSLAELLLFTLGVCLFLGDRQYYYARRVDDAKLWADFVRSYEEPFPEVSISFCSPLQEAPRAQYFWLDRLSDRRSRRLGDYLGHYAFSYFRGIKPPTVKHPWKSDVPFECFPPIRTLAISNNRPTIRAGGSILLPAYDASERVPRPTPEELADRINAFQSLQELGLHGLGSRASEILEHIHPERVEHLRLGVRKDTHFEVLKRLTRLRRLTLYFERENDDEPGNRIDDMSFSPPPLTRLEELTIHGHNITPRVLAWMKRLPRLKVLYVYSERLTFPSLKREWAYSVGQLRQELPDVSVIHTLGTVGTPEEWRGRDYVEPPEKEPQDQEEESPR